MAERSAAPDAGPVTDDARVVGVDSTDAAAVIDAVGSETARAVLESLHEQPSTASGLADRVDCSLQTVGYHLDNLADAGLVEVVDAATSEKGREMDVYGPADGPVVVYAGEADESDLRSVLGRLVSALGLLAVGSLLVQELFGGTAEPAAAEMTADTAAGSGGGAAAAGGVEPGLVFFAGGLVVLAASLGWWALRRRGHLDGLPVGG